MQKLEIQNRPLCEIANCGRVSKIRTKHGDGTYNFLKLCSMHQKAKFPNTGTRYGVPVVRVCRQCSKSFPTTDHRKFFCSNSCAKKSAWDKHKQHRKKSEYKRKRMISASCEVCGFDIYESLNVHHLVGIRTRNSQNSKLNIVLCANCHSILHHKIGWGVDIPIITKQQTVEIIRNVRSSKV